MRDDTYNRSCEIDHRENRLKDRTSEKKKSGETPFYERLRHHSECFETKIRQRDRAEKEQLSFNAAYLDGVCLIPPGRIEDHSKLDEKKSLIEA